MPRSRKPDNTNHQIAVASEHLRDRGHQLLASGIKKQPFDIVSLDRTLLVFTTVRVLPDAHAKADYVTERQRLNVRNAAAQWLAANPQSVAREIRFDSIAITFTESGRVIRLDHVEALY